MLAPTVKEVDKEVGRGEGEERKREKKEKGKVKKLPTVIEK